MYCSEFASVAPQKISIFICNSYTVPKNNILLLFILCMVRREPLNGISSTVNDISEGLTALPLADIHKLSGNLNYSTVFYYFKFTGAESHNFRVVVESSAEVQQMVRYGTRFHEW